MNQKEQLSPVEPRLAFLNHESREKLTRLVDHLLADVGLEETLRRFEEAFEKRHGVKGGD